MIVTKVKKQVDVVVDDGWSLEDGNKWVGDICSASIDGYPGIVITMRGVELASLHNLDKESFQLVITKGGVVR